MFKQHSIWLFYVYYEKITFECNILKQVLTLKTLGESPTKNLFQK